MKSSSCGIACSHSRTGGATGGGAGSVKAAARTGSGLGAGGGGSIARSRPPRRRRSPGDDSNRNQRAWCRSQADWYPSRAAPGEFKQEVDLTVRDGGTNAILPYKIRGGSAECRSFPAEPTSRLQNCSARGRPSLPRRRTQLRVNASSSTRPPVRSVQLARSPTDARRPYGVAPGLHQSLRPRPPKRPT